MTAPSTDAGQDGAGLLPCPFCGAAAQAFCHEMAHDEPWWVVGCANEDCRIMDSSAGNSSRDEAIAAWNTRPTPSPAAAYDLAKAIKAEVEQPLQGPNHGAWDRGRLAGLKEAVKIANSMAPSPAVALVATQDSVARAAFSLPAALEVGRLREALDVLQQREAAYRYAHDHFGDGDLRAGHAWDKMRRAGDAARVALVATQDSAARAALATQPDPVEAGGANPDSKRIERLRRILHRYGDRVPLAMCHRPDWQQEIDEAMEWAVNNPEPAPPSSGDGSEVRHG